MDQQIPDRPLPDDVRARRRVELMTSIGSGHEHRRRWLVPAAAAAVVAGLVGGGYAVSRAANDPAPPRSERSLEVAGSGEATPSVAPSATSTTDCGDITTAQLERSLRRHARQPVWEDPAIAPVLASYRDIVARHLDPAGQHLQRDVSGVQMGGSIRCGVSSLGTKLGWTVAGEDGEGMVQVEVNRSAHGSQVAMSLDGWEPVPSGLPGVTRAEVARDGGRTAVLVTRADGLVVGIIADPLFGNNSLTPVSDLDVSVDDLVATAADPDLALPAS
ncbi:hypothetical protein [Nocardioides sp. MH1]|uniref:hypothetical protein n=1 Tax=Nocardioides sp. MH1 TaxID=3242490 RepID=UPI003520AF6D